MALYFPQIFNLPGLQQVLCGAPGARIDVELKVLQPFFLHNPI
jgi:hypothetical protein